MEVINILKYVVKNGGLNGEKLVDVLLSHLSDEELIRVIAYSYDMEEIPTLAKVSDVNPDALKRRCEFVSADYVNGTVKYKYSQLNKRYFNNENDACDWRNHKGSYWAGVSSKDEQHSIEATRIDSNESYCYSFKEWNDNEVK